MRGYAGLVIGLIMFVLLVSVGGYVISSAAFSQARVSSARDFIRSVQAASDSTHVSIKSVEWNAETNLITITMVNDGSSIIDVSTVRIFADGIVLGRCGELNCAESTPDGAWVPKEILAVTAQVPYVPYRVSVSAGEHAGRVGSTDLNNWYSGCKYRRLVFVRNNTSSTLSDFQIAIDLGPDFDYSKSSASEVLVTGSDGLTPLPFWVEYWNVSGNSRIWITADLPASESNYVYLYYGCTSVPTYAPSDVFLHDINDLVAYWPLDGNGADASGNGKDLNVYGVSWASGWRGSGAYLDGGTDSYLIRNPFNNFPSSEITAYFFMETNDTANTGVPISYASSADPDDFAVMNYRNLRVYVAGNYKVPGLAFNDGVWHGVAVTWTNTDGSLLVYDNGAQVYSGGPLSEGNVITDGGSLVLGQDQDALAGGFDSDQSYIGYLDEVMIFSRTLSATEIADIYNESYFVSPYYPGHLLVRRRASSEPTVDVRPEEAYSMTFTS